jgi:hypothetical protein
MDVRVILAAAVIAALLSAPAAHAEGAPTGLDTTRIAVEPLPLSVGYIQYVMYPDGCSIVDGETEAHFGVNIGASYRAWVVWPLDEIPVNANIEQVEVEHYLWPSGDPNHQTQYRALSELPSNVPDCQSLWDQLNGTVYTEYYTGVTEGLQRHTLGGSAAEDLEGRLAVDDWFGIGITAAAGVTGDATIPGWSSGGPELIVTWSVGSPVERSTWASIKAVLGGRSN